MFTDSQHAREVALNLSVKRELKPLDLQVVKELYAEYHHDSYILDIIKYRLWKMPIAEGSDANEIQVTD